MEFTEDDIPTFPIHIFMYDNHGFSWTEEHHFTIVDANMTVVFEGGLKNDEKNRIYNVELKEGNYNVIWHDDLKYNSHVVWDIYIYTNKTLKKICSSHDTDGTDNFVISYDDFQTSDTINTNTATIDNLRVKNIQFGDLPYNLTLNTVNSNYNDEYYLSYHKYPVTRIFNYNENNVDNKSNLLRNLIWSYPVKK